MTHRIDTSTSTVKSKKTTNKVKMRWWWVKRG